jgi:hypothetical protein
MDRTEYLRRHIELGRELIRRHEELLKEERNKLAANLAELRKICTHKYKVDSIAQEAFPWLRPMICTECGQQKTNDFDR